MRNNCSRQLTNEDLIDFSNQYGLDLNSSFMKFYKICNGGYPEKFDSVLGINNIFPIHGFESIKYGNLPIETLINDFKDFNLKGKFIPFAHDQGNNLFVLSLEENKDEVLLFIAEEQEFFDVSWKSFDFFQQCFVYYETIINMSEAEKKQLKRKLFP